MKQDKKPFWVTNQNPITMFVDDKYKDDIAIKRALKQRNKLNN